MRIIPGEDAGSELKLATGLTVHYDVPSTSSYPKSGSTLYDISAGGLNATLNGGATYSSTAGGSIYLDGQSGFIKLGPVPNSGSSTTSWSMGIWISPNTPLGNIVQMTASEPVGGWTMPPLFASNKRFTGTVWSNNNLTTTSDYKIGNWYYLTLVFNYAAGSQTFYVNGVQVATQTGITSSPSGTNNYMDIGKSATFSADDVGWFNGYVGNFHFYGNKALSAAEVAENYNALYSRYVSATISDYVTNGLGLYVDSNVGSSYLSGSTWTDISGAGLNLTGTGNLTASSGLNSALTTASPWVTASTNLLNTDTHTISFALKFNSTAKYPEGYSGNWEKILSFNPTGTDRSPSIWRWPSNRYLHWRYDPGNTGSNLGPTNNPGDNPPALNFSADSWYIVTGVKNGSTFTFYVDGVNVGSSTVTATKTAGASAIQLFESYTLSSATVDSLMVYNRSLSDAEIAQNYTALKARYLQRPETVGLVMQLEANNSSSYPGSGTTWSNISGRSYAGTLANVTYNSAKGGYLSFNGSTSLVTYPEDSLMNTQVVSVEAWIRTNALSQNGFIFEKGNVNTQYALFQEGSNIVWRQNFGTTAGDASSYTNLVVNNSQYMNATDWAHIVGTYSSGSRNLYINGMLVASDAQTGTINTNANGSSIGVYGGSNGGRGYWYNGDIGEVRVYARALAASEVLSNYNNTRKRYQQSPTSFPSAPAFASAAVVNATTVNISYGAIATNGKPMTALQGSGTNSGDIYDGTGLAANLTYSGTLNPAGGTIQVTGNFAVNTNYNFYINGRNANGAGAGASTSTVMPYFSFAPFGFTPFAFTPFGFTPFAFTPFAFTPFGFTPFAFTPFAFTPFAFTPFGFTPFGFTPGRGARIY
jgi:hypothetical protein